MSSPFPGVNPYLESQGYWPDFHSRFINRWCEVLAERLPDNYEARIEERVNLVELPAEGTKLIRPDVAIAQRQSSIGGTARPAGVATLEPVTIPLVIQEETREAYIKILQRPERTLVAVLELLSPGNKEQPGRGMYIGRRDSLLYLPVHLVELDFLVGGQRLPLARDYPAGECFALVAHAGRRPDCDVYAWGIRHPLPPIPIPLRLPDPDVLIDLGAVFATSYERGHYTRSVDYSAPLGIPLRPEDLAWAQEQARRGMGGARNGG